MLIESVWGCHQSARPEEFISFRVRRSNRRQLGNDRAAIAHQQRRSVSNFLHVVTGILLQFSNANSFHSSNVAHDVLQRFNSNRVRVSRAMTLVLVHCLREIEVEKNPGQSNH
jgi:hypothetical protein